jgi:hypothetical protein
MVSGGAGADAGAHLSNWLSHAGHPESLVKAAPDAIVGGPDPRIGSMVQRENEK